MQAPSPRPFVLTALALALGLGSTHAQSWERAVDHPGDPGYVQLDYPVAFVATTGHADPGTQTAPHFGLDVISASNVSPHGNGGGLHVLLPDGAVKKLFPLPVHDAEPGLIDTPTGELWRGAVVEPNVSENGRTLYFAWFHDATWEWNGGGWQSAELSFKGADLYRLDVGPLLDDPSTDPATLAVKRLTFKQYNGPAKTNVTQTAASRLAHAANPSLALSGAANYWGTIDMHLVEMRTATGLKAVWVSNRARLGNSNLEFGDPNHNFNLYIADIRSDGSLGPAEQWQYYTTTSALSPTPMRDGISFSYQSTTEGARRWDIQAIDSVGRWAPLLGYAHRSELFHLGTLIARPDGAGGIEDHFIGVKYYNLNDGGFGQLHTLLTKDAGVNTFQPGVFATVPVQLSTLLTIGVTAEDAPSPTVQVGGETRYVGKFSSPRAGRFGGEYLMAYTPTSANRWLNDAEGNTGVFEAYIAYRPNLEPFEPHEPVDVDAGRGLRTLIADATKGYDAIWPTPLLSWMERTGKPRQDFQMSVVHPTTPIARGLPFAEVGTSAIYNTDLRPYDCYRANTGSTPWHPNELTANENIAMNESVDGLRYVQDPDDFCHYLQPETVLGIAVNITSNEVDADAPDQPGYETDTLGQKELMERLGVYSVADENEADWSFMARIPANTPFDFHLLDVRYGMKLVDVRSWHSLKPRERRTNCGGCHQHEAGTAIPFQGKEASRKPALDMTRETKYVTYDADCKPQLAVASTPTRSMPEWTEDVWPGFDQHCGACHNATVSTNTAALAALDYVDEANAYRRIRGRKYANSIQGALGSPAFWAAYGARTDGRDNDLPQYQPNYPAGDWGFFHSDVHATAPGLCAASNPAWAEWVHTFGLWIDNHMPRDTGQTPYGSKFDRFPPTIDFGLTDDLASLRVGFWDNRGVQHVEVFVNGIRLGALVSLPNGSFTVPVPSFTAFDRIKLVATDGRGNRNIREKTVQELLDDMANEFQRGTFGYHPVR